MMNKNMNEKSRRVFRSVVLVVILIVCVGIAWLLAEYRSAASREGTRIVETLRRDGMAKYWGGKSHLDCYVILKSGKPVGWYVYHVAPTEGGYVGGNIYHYVYSSIKSTTAISRWQLSNDASSGRYVSSSYKHLNGVKEDTLGVEIEATDKTVALSQTIDDMIILASSGRPKNYLAEDITGLALAMVAKEKTAASFKIIYDQMPSSPGGAINFLTYKAEYIGESEDFPGASQLEVKTSIGDSPESYDIYIIGDNGKILARNVGDTVDRHVTAEELQKVFPDAAALIKALTQ